MWPGSALARKKPKWFVASELVETSQRFARTLARIQPEWIEPLAEHLVKREHGEAHWDSGSGNIMCWEKVTLWGLPIVPRRKTSYAKINPVKSRELLIDCGLVQLGLLHGHTLDEITSEFEDEENALRGQRKRLIPGKSDVRTTFQTDGKDKKEAVGRSRGWGKDFPFLKHNVRILQGVEALQARTRRHDLLPSSDWVYDFYDQLIPEDVTDRNSLRRWYRRIRKSNPGVLQFEENQFADAAVQQESTAEFPSHICLLYTSPSPRDQRGSRMPSSA